MADPFIGEIKIFSGNYAPQGWAPCDGRLLPIMQYQALFAVIGNTYGGDGKTTFALPNLQGRVPLHAGQGNGLTNRAIGATGGATTVTLGAAQMPAHQHSHLGSAAPGAGNSPVNAAFATDEAGTISCYRAPAPTDRTLRADALSLEGSSQAHNNMQPYQVLSFCIALQGLFPPRQ